MARFQARPNFKAVNIVKDMLDNGDLKKIADTHLVAPIVRRTGAGMDQNNRPFKPLGRRHAQYKLRRLGHSRADLRLSGAMLGSMRTKQVTKRQARIGFSSGAMERRASSNEDLGRRFMSPDAVMVANFRRALVKRLRLKNRRRA